jgi:F-type H+-transporting ATPase subunit delta
VTLKTAAARYARALLDVATNESADLDNIATELDDFIRFLKAQAALDRVLLNPAVPAARKRAAVVEMMKLARLSPVVSKLLVLLADRDRLGLLNELAAAYHGMLADRQQVVRAEVTSAEPLSRQRVDAIEKRLATMTGRRVVMTTKVDETIIGGVVARVGSTVYDASLETQLKKIRERLTM